MLKSRRRRSEGAVSLRRRELLKLTVLASVVGVGQLAGGRLAFADTGLVALVHTQAAGDSGPVDSMIASLGKFSHEHGARTRTIYASDPSAYEGIFNNLGAAGASIVITTFNEVTESLKAVAPKYPKTHFIQLFADPMTPTIGNVTTVEYAYYLGCYLSGLFGALISKTNKLGYVGGASIPPLNADLHAMQAGAKASGKPDVTVTSAFAGSFQDPGKGHAIASQMFASSIDYVQVDSGATDMGVIGAAREHAGGLVSGVSPSQYKLAPQSVPAIVELNFGLSLYQQATKALEPGAKGGHIVQGLDSGVVAFELSDVFLSQGDTAQVAAAKKAWPVVEAARKKILSGELKVPFNTAL